MKLKIYNIMCDTNYAQDGSNFTDIKLQLALHGTDDDNMRIALAWARDIACDDLLKHKNGFIAQFVGFKGIPSVPEYKKNRYTYNIPDWLCAEYYVKVTEVDLSFSPGIFAREEFDDYDTSHLCNGDIEMMVADAEEEIWNDDAFLYAFNSVKQRIAEEYKLIKK